MQTCENTLPTPSGGTDMMQVALWPALYPFAGQPSRCAVIAGQRLQDVVREALKDRPGLLPYAVVYLNGEKIAPCYWRSLRLKPGVMVDIRCVPQGGGGGKNPLATILSIGLMAVAPMIGGALVGSLGLAGQGLWLGSTFFSAGTLIGGAVALTGRLLISALLPPAKPRNAIGRQEKTAQFIQGARNTFAPFGTIPQVLGKTRMMPFYAAPAYTETVGNDQYVRMLFTFGYGPVDLSDLKIGETSISEFTNVEWEFIPEYDGISVIPLYPSAVLQDEYNVLLQETDGWVLRTSKTDANEISLDVTFPQGLVRFTGSGSQTEQEVRLEVQYSLAGADEWSAGVSSFKPISAVNSPAMPRPKGSGGYYGRRMLVYRVVMDPASGALSTVVGNLTTVGLQEPHVPSVPGGKLPIAQVWRYSDDPIEVPSENIIDERGASLTNGTFEDSGDFLPAASLTANVISIAAGGLKFPGIYVRAKQGGALRRSVVFQVPEPGQYDVRIRRLSPDTDSTQIFDKAYLTGLRTIRYANPVRQAGQALLAMRIKATDQLNGAPDQVNALVQLIAPDWDEVAEEWITRPTQNPASIYRHVLQGSANGRPATDDWINLPQLQDWAEWCAAEGFEYNAVIDNPLSVKDMLGEVAAAGRAATHAPELKWGVIREIPDAVPVQMFTPANTWGFSGTLNYPDVPHALRVRFINADSGYVPDEAIVYADGYNKDNAEKYESIEAAGCTNYNQAWRFGRYYLANMILRPETYTFMADVGALECTRGDVVKLQHDAVLIGLGSGWITDIQTNGEGDITAITVDDGFLMVAGKNYAVRIRQNNGKSVYRTVQTVAGEQSTLSFTTPMAVPDPTDAPDVGDLVGFGEAGLETISVVIKSITYDADFRAELTCVDYAPAIQTADTGTIPPHQPVVTIPPELMRPPAPQLVSFQSDEQVLIRNPDGSFTAVAVLTLEPVGWPVRLDAVLKVKGIDETEFYTPTYTYSGNRITIFGLSTAQYYDIRVHYVTTDGKASPALTLSGVLVLGDTNPPSDVQNFKVSVLAETAFLSWDAVRDIDLDHYILKFSNATEGVTWGSSVPLIPVISREATGVTVQARDGTYLIKAVDRGGRESVSATLIVAKGAGLANYNALETIEESPLYPGVRDGVVVTDIGLRLDNAGSVDDWENWEEIDNVDVSEEGMLTEGTYYFATVLDLSEVYASRITALIEAEGLDLNNIVDNYENFDTIANIDGGVDSSEWDVRLQIASTNDDPEGDPTWSEWRDFVIGEYTGRAHKFRAILLSLSYNITPQVTDLSVTIDMPTRVEGADDVLSFMTDNPTVVPFDPPFKVKPALAVTAQSMASGDYFEITNQTRNGFNIVFKNALGARITRTFDYVAKGYGRDITEV